jgi:hypothetical protein
MDAHIDSTNRPFRLPFEAVNASKKKLSVFVRARPKQRYPIVDSQKKKIQRPFILTLSSPKLCLAGEATKYRCLSAKTQRLFDLDRRHTVPDDISLSKAT